MNPEMVDWRNTQLARAKGLPGEADRPDEDAGSWFRRQLERRDAHLRWLEAAVARGEVVAADAIGRSEVWGKSLHAGLDALRPSRTGIDTRDLVDGLARVVVAQDEREAAVKARAMTAPRPAAPPASVAGAGMPAVPTGVVAGTRPGLTPYQQEVRDRAIRAVAQHAAYVGQVETALDSGSMADPLSALQVLATYRYMATGALGRASDDLALTHAVKSGIDQVRALDAREAELRPRLEAMLAR